MEPLLDLAREHHLLVIEDCAQAFAGTRYQGHPRADASMFSFGTIKSSTALGGAVLRVRDRELLARMRVAQAAYPVQGRFAYFKRVAKCAVLKLLASRPISAVLAHTCRTMGCNYDRWVNQAARGFPGDDLLTQIRRQPSSPLLAVLARRLRRHAPHRSDRHAAKGRVLAEMLRDAVCCPGATVVPHAYWVFPILVDQPNRLIEQLACSGFDATQGHSLCVTAAPADRPALRPSVAEGILKQIVFLPFYPELPDGEAQRMAAAVREFADHRWSGQAAVRGVTSPPRPVP
jgi:dTDP-4-amino-4,6-dideoxygalactose transaminase